MNFNQFSYNKYSFLQFNMAIKNLVFLLFFTSSLTFIESSRILGILPLNSKSHDGMFSSLMKGLAEHGHQVDVITQFPLKNPPANYKVIANLNGTAKPLINSLTVDFARAMSGNPTFSIGDTYGNKLCDLLGLEEIQKLVKNPPKNPPYDLVISHTFGSNCFMGLAHVLKVPLIALCTSAEWPWMTYFIGNNDNLAYAQNTLLLEFDKFNFWDRLQNVFSYYYTVYLFHYITGTYQTEAMRKYLDPNIPNIREIERSVALTLVNRHPVLFGTKPITSSLIEVSGLHVQKNPPKLSQDLQKWLDEASHGVVYFTFGSMVNIETLPDNKILDIYKAFSKISPVKVLMKIADKSKLPAGLPKNVLISPWIPQQAVLNHKNVRVFITHGGLMGCQEALYYGVPLIGVPLFADQTRNIQTFVEKKTAIKIDFNNLTSAALNDALDEILNNPEYQKNAKIQSQIFKDRPMNAMDTAIFWIEYVIRNGDNTLRSPALDLYWWQLTLIDVYTFILLCIIMAMTLMYYIINVIRKQIKLLCSKPPKSEKKKKKNN